MEMLERSHKQLRAANTFRLMEWIKGLVDKFGDSVLFGPAVCLAFMIPATSDIFKCEICLV